MAQLYLSVLPQVHSFIHPSIHPSIHLPIHSFIYPSNHPSIHPFLHPFIHPSIYPFIHPFIQPSIHPFIYSFIYHSHTISQCRAGVLCPQVVSSFDASKVKVHGEGVRGQGNLASVPVSFVIDTKEAGAADLDVTITVSGSYKAFYR